MKHIIKALLTSYLIKAADVEEFDDSDLYIDCVPLYPDRITGTNPDPKWTNLEKCIDENDEEYFHRKELAVGKNDNTKACLGQNRNRERDSDLECQNEMQDEGACCLATINDEETYHMCASSSMI